MQGCPVTGVEARFSPHGRVPWLVSGAGHGERHVPVAFVLVLVVVGLVGLGANVEVVVELGTHDVPSSERESGTTTALERGPRLRSACSRARHTAIRARASVAGSSPGGRRGNRSPRIRQSSLLRCAPSGPGGGRPLS